MPRNLIPVNSFDWVNGQSVGVSDFQIKDLKFKVSGFCCAFDAWEKQKPARMNKIENVTSRFLMSICFYSERFITSIFTAKRFR